MRFPCPSTGEVVNRRSLQAPSIVVHPQRPQTPCSILNSFHFNNMPHQIICNESIPSFVPPFLKREMMLLAHEMTIKKNSILEGFRQRISKAAELTGFDVVSKVSLHDVFMVVERGKYPLLWREVMKIHTIIPTTVSCEQSFSVMKHSFHPNMKTRTFTARARNKIHERTEMVRF